MERREALAVIGAVLAVTPVMAGGQYPYGPGNSTDYRVVDLVNVREVILRFSDGNVTLQTRDLFKALMTPEKPAGA